MFVKPFVKIAFGCLAAAVVGNVFAAVNSPAAAMQLNPNALVRAQQKLTRVQQIVESFTPSAKEQNLPEGWRMEMLSNLMQGTEKDFAGVILAPDVRTALVTARQIATTSSASNASTAKNLGDSDDDLVFQPIPPCRDVDTRNAGSGGPLAAHETRMFVVNNSSTQGQTCNPGIYFNRATYPAAIAVNITVVNIGYPGVVGAFLQAYPDGSPTSASWLNYNPNSVVANAGILATNSANQGAFDITAQTETDVVVDIFGFFGPPISQTINQPAAALQCVSETSAAAAGAIAVGADNLIFSPNCPTGSTVVGGGCTATDSAVVLSISAPFGVAYVCQYHNNSAKAQTVSASATCCSVPSQNIVIP